MKVNRKLLILLCSAILACSCSDKNSLLTISGNLQNADGKTIKLTVITSEGIDSLDEKKIRNGHFKFSFPENDDRIAKIENSPMMFQLLLSDENYVSIMASKGDKINISANASDLTKTYKISGGEEAALSHLLDSVLINDFINPTDELYTIYQKNIENDSVRADIEEKYNVLLANHKQFLLDFIEKHPYNMTSYIAFFQGYNKRVFFDMYKDVEILKRINSNLQKKYPESEYVKSMIRTAEIIEERKQQISEQ